MKTFGACAESCANRNRLFAEAEALFFGKKWAKDDLEQYENILLFRFLRCWFVSVDIIIRDTLFHPFN